MRFFLLPVFTVLTVLMPLISCTTVDYTIPQGSESELYFLKAQLAFDHSDLDKAMSIYEKCVADFPSDLSATVRAKYEIAVLTLKQGKKAQAQALFQEVLAQYDDSAKSAALPSWVKVLAQKKLVQLTPTPLLVNP